MSSTRSSRGALTRWRARSAPSSDEVQSHVRTDALCLCGSASRPQVLLISSSPVEQQSLYTHEEHANRYGTADVRHRAACGDCARGPSRGAADPPLSVRRGSRRRERDRVPRRRHSRLRHRQGHKPSSSASRHGRRLPGSSRSRSAALRPARALDVCSSAL